MCISFPGSGCGAAPAGPGREGGTAAALAQFKQREPNGSDVQADGHGQPWDLTAAHRESSHPLLPQQSSPLAALHLDSAFHPFQDPRAQKGPPKLGAPVVQIM